MLLKIINCCWHDTHYKRTAIVSSDFFYHLKCWIEFDRHLFIRRMFLNLYQSFSQILNNVGLIFEYWVQCNTIITKHLFFNNYNNKIFFHGRKKLYSIQYKTRLAYFFYKIHLYNNVYTLFYYACVTRNIPCRDNLVYRYFIIKKMLVRL